MIHLRYMQQHVLTSHVLFLFHHVVQVCVESNTSFTLLFEVNKKYAYALIHPSELLHLNSWWKIMCIVRFN